MRKFGQEPQARSKAPPRQYDVRDWICLVLCVVGVEYALVLGTVFLVTGRTHLAVADYAAAMVIAAVGFWIWKKPGSLQPRRFLAIFASLFFLYVYLHGGSGGVLWGILVPALSPLFLGLKGGLVLSACYLFALLGAAALGPSVFPRMDLLSPIEWVRFAGTYAMAGIICSLYEFMTMKDRATIERERKHYRFLADHMTDVVWTTDMDLNTTYVSPSVQTVLGVPVDEYRTRTMEQNYAPESTERAKALLGEELRRERDPHCDRNRTALYEAQQRTGDGRYVWVSVHAAFIRDEDETPIGILGVTRDITERKKTEDALRESNEKLKAAIAHAREMAKHAQEANQAKSRFLAHMSHEIRTPLNAILGFAQLLHRESALSAEQRMHIETISHSGEHLLALISNVLDLAKIEAGQQALTYAAFDVHALLADVLSMLRLRAEAKGLALSVEGVGRAPKHIRADAQKLRQILINMVGNAVKFTEVGSIGLRVFAHQREAKQWLLTFEVEDTGPGIAPEERDRIFEAFEQSQCHRGRGQGTGLGLTISRQLARLMGGDLTVDSELGKGSLFRFDIPVELAPGIAEEDVSPAPVRSVLRLAEGQTPCRVLVADDSDDNRLFLSLLLAQVGFEVVEARDGGEAVRLFKRHQPALVLVDEQMPVLDGCQVIAQIRRHPKGKRATLVAVTADITGPTQHALHVAGADAFLAKPFRADALFETLRRHAGLRFLYADSEAAPAVAPCPGDDTAGLYREFVAGLSDEMRKQLLSAIIGGHRERLEALIVEATADHSNLREALLLQAKRFEYEPLIRIFQFPDARGRSGAADPMP